VGGYNGTVRLNTSELYSPATVLAYERGVV